MENFRGNAFFLRTVGLRAGHSSPILRQRVLSGKFDTNYLVCTFAAVGMHLSCLIEQNKLNDSTAPHADCGLLPDFATLSAASPTTLERGGYRLA